MSSVAIIIILVLAAAAVVAYLVLGKKGPPPAELEEPPAPERLAEKAPAAKLREAPKSRAEAAEKEPSKRELAPTKAAKALPAPAEKPAVTPPKAAPVDVESEQAPPAKAKAPERPAPTPLTARKRDVEGLRKGLSKVREQEGFFGRLKALFSGKREIDPRIVEEMEEVLLTSDVGVKTTEALIGGIRAQLAKNELKDEAVVWDALRAHATKILAIGSGGLALPARPTVVMVVGVNGVGKTTTIGKLATKLHADGKKVVLAAGDTFRAAATQQLGVWAKRVGCEVVTGKDGANPGAVIFDAIQRAKEIDADVVLADTAGRLHTKTNLMEELTKVTRTMSKALDGAPHETLLVLDATNGQNALQQAAMFKETLPLSGIVLTKLDGTAKGGIILGICAEHGIPVRYIGIGERAEDLRDFNADEFIEAMLGQPTEPATVAA
jgi:fused signal recognition particle receptor